MEARLKIARAAIGPLGDLNNLDKSFRAPLDAADGGATPGRRGELGFPVYLAFVAIPAGSVRRRPPTAPGGRTDLSRAA